MTREERDEAKRQERLRKADAAAGKSSNGDARQERQPCSPEPKWPEPLEKAAYHGILGEIVRKIEPETESDPNAVMFQLQTGIGNIIGNRSGYVIVDDDKHSVRLFGLIVGDTSRGRKGTGWGRARALLLSTVPEWAGCIKAGLSSGEGLIHAVRDPRYEDVEDKKTNSKTLNCIDPGVTEKRLLVFEGEISTVFKNMERPGNNLSGILRDAWDHGNLSNLTKNSPDRANGAHISIVGHITADELRRVLTRTEMANGLANRFLFVCSRRSKKLLPFGGGQIDWGDIPDRLRLILAGVPGGQVQWTNSAKKIWQERYPILTEGRPGLLGALLARAEAQALRLSLLYTLLDGKSFIEPAHVNAGLACWTYAEASAEFIFGEALGDPVADEILRALRQQPEGMTRNDLMNHFGRNQASAQLDRALSLLARANLAAMETERRDGPGRPTERWRAI